MSTTGLGIGRPYAVIVSAVFSILLLLSGCDSSIVGPSAKPPVPEPHRQTKLAEVWLEFDLTEGTVRQVSIPYGKATTLGLPDFVRTPSEFSADIHRINHIFVQDTVLCPLCNNGATGKHVITVVLKHNNPDLRAFDIQLRDKYCYHCSWDSDTTSPNPLGSLVYQNLFDVIIEVTVESGQTRFGVWFNIFGDTNFV